jgi:uncharacterized Fe-S cluster-containing radical SAM superfamily enzyme
METKYNKELDGSITVSINVKLEGTMLSQEEQIEQALVELGLKMSQLSVESFDTDGSPIIVSNEKYTSKGQQKKRFKHPTAK